MSIFNIEGASTGSSSENNYSFGIATEEEFMLDVDVDVNVDVNANSDVNANVNANEQKLPETQANTSSLPAETPKSDADVNTDAHPDPVQVNVAVNQLLILAPCQSQRLSTQTVQ